MTWRGRGELNAEPLVLETSALPIELHPLENACPGIPEPMSVSGLCEQAYATVEHADAVAYFSKLAEDVGFEPMRRGTPDRSAFKTAAIDLSANLPDLVPQQGFEP